MGKSSLGCKTGVFRTPSFFSRRAIAMAPIGATKRIIERNSNGSRNSVNRRYPIRWIFPVGACSTTSFDCVIEDILDHDVLEIVVINERKSPVRTANVILSPAVRDEKKFRDCGLLIGITANTIKTFTAPT